MNQSQRAVLCPYCGSRQSGERCRACGGLFEPLSRKATQLAMGPWYLRDEAAPFRPGCSYEVLKRQVELGKVKLESVIRGPTTRQFWALAQNVPGVAHLLGRCHACAAPVVSNAACCPQCRAEFHAVTERNLLGLQYPTAEAVAAAQETLERETEARQGSRSGASGAAAGDGGTGAHDLLDEALNPSPTGLKSRRGAAILAASRGEMVDEDDDDDDDDDLEFGTRALNAPAAAARPAAAAPVAVTHAATAVAALPSAAKPADRRVMTWLLVSLNVLFIVLLVLFALQMRSGGAASSDAQRLEIGQPAAQREVPAELPEGTPANDE